MHRQIGILVSAMILGAQLGQSAHAAQPTTDQLREIASLLSTDDYTGLRSFLRAHPDLLIENTALAGLLRQFLSSGSTEAATNLDRDLSDALSRFSSQDSRASDSPGAASGTSQY